MQDPKKEKDQRIVDEVQGLMKRDVPIARSSHQLSSIQRLSSETQFTGRESVSIRSVLDHALSQMGIYRDIFFFSKKQEKWPNHIIEKVSLLTVLGHVDDILSILKDPVVKEQLLPYLPPTLKTKNELFETLNTPQFQETINLIEKSILSGNIHTILASYDIVCEGMSPFGDTLAFLRAIQDDANIKKKEKE